MKNSEIYQKKKEVKALFPRAEKLKKYIKDIFEAQAIEHRQNQVFKNSFKLKFF